MFHTKTGKAPGELAKQSWSSYHHPTDWSLPAAVPYPMPQGHCQLPCALFLSPPGPWGYGTTMARLRLYPHRPRGCYGERVGSLVSLAPPLWKPVAGPAPFISLLKEDHPWPCPGSDKLRGQPNKTRGKAVGCLPPLSSPPSPETPCLAVAWTLSSKAASPPHLTTQCRQLPGTPVPTGQIRQ